MYTYVYLYVYSIVDKCVHVWYSVYTMAVTVREFRKNLALHLDSKEDVVILKWGKPIAILKKNVMPEPSKAPLHAKVDTSRGAVKVPLNRILEKAPVIEQEVDPTKPTIEQAPPIEVVEKSTEKVAKIIVDHSKFMCPHGQPKNLCKKCMFK